MSNAILLAIDQGTTNSKVLALDARGTVVSRGSAALPIYHPQDGWVEQRPEELWESVQKALQSCVAGLDPSQIVGIGISNQRESVLAWHAETSEPLGPCISWQCRRTAPECAKLKAEGHEPSVQAITGLPIDPMFPATKLAWLLKSIYAERPHISSDEIRIGTVDSWLLWNFTGGRAFACDASNAARTQLYHLTRGVWNAELAELFEVKLELLPEVLPSNAAFGQTRGLGFMPDGIPIHAMLGDSHAALFGYGVTEPGTVKVTYGTGSSLMAPITRFVVPQGGITTTIAWMLDSDPTYALEGNILVSASSLPWASRLLGCNGDVAELSALAERASDAGGVHFVPAFVGLGAPHWDSEARALFGGISFRTGREEMARAVFDGLAHQISDVFEVMDAHMAQPVERLLADGGASCNTFLMQLQADQLGVPVVPSDVPEASALGAGLMAGIALGIWESADDVAALNGKRPSIHPAITAQQRGASRTAWRHAVAQARL